jgi:adenylylsulfate kinase-like enzyme
VERRDADGVVITGVCGSGKSSVAAEIAYMLEQRHQPYALLDLDYLRWAGTGSGERAGVGDSAETPRQSRHLLRTCRRWAWPRRTSPR